MRVTLDNSTGQFDVTIPPNCFPGMQFHMNIPDTQQATRMPPSSPAAKKVLVTVPSGMGPGDKLRVDHNFDGRLAEVEIPAGVYGNQSFYIESREMRVTVPVGCGPGQQIRVAPDNDGKYIDVLVPAGVFQNQSFVIDVPKAIAPQRQSPPPPSSSPSPTMQLMNPMNQFPPQHSHSQQIEMSQRQSSPPPSPPPPPRPKSPSPSAAKKVLVTVPSGMGPGDKLRVDHNFDGRLAEVEIPAGVYGNQSFYIESREMRVTVPVGCGPGQQIRVAPDNDGKYIDVLVPAGVFQNQSFVIDVPKAIAPQRQSPPPPSSSPSPTMQLMNPMNQFPPQHSHSQHSFNSHSQQQQLQPGMSSSEKVMMVINVVCPPDMGAGDDIQASPDNGRTHYHCTIPAGVRPGQLFRVQIPTSLDAFVKSNAKANSLEYQAVFILNENQPLDLEVAWKLFDLIDLDKTRRLNRAEMMNVCVNEGPVHDYLEKYRKSPLGLLRKPGRVLEIFDLVDDDNNGVIDEAEWRTFLATLIDRDAHFAFEKAFTRGNCYWARAGIPPRDFSVPVVQQETTSTYGVPLPSRFYYYPFDWTEWWEDYKFFVRNYHGFIAIFLSHADNGLVFSQRLTIEWNCLCYTLFIQAIVSLKNPTTEVEYGYIFAFVTLPTLAMRIFLICLFTCPCLVVRHDHTKARKEYFPGNLIHYVYVISSLLFSSLSLFDLLDVPLSLFLSISLSLYLSVSLSLFLLPSAEKSRCHRRYVDLCRRLNFSHSGCGVSKRA